MKNNLTNSRRLYDPSKKLQIHRRLHPHVYVENPASERQDRTEPVLVQNSGHVGDDIPISALDVFYEMDGRKGRYIKKKCWFCILKKMP